MARDTLLDFFEDYFTSDEPFIVHDDGYRVREVSYREMADAARAFATRLASHGVAPDDRVVIWSENRAEWVAALWGCLIARVVLVPVDYRASTDLVRRVSAIVQARVLAIGSEVAELTGATGDIWRLGDVIEFRSSKFEVQSSKVSGTTLAEIIFTSGATADPKGVTITHRNVLANILPIEREIRKYRKYERPFHPVRFLNLLPLSHMFGQSMATFVPPMLGGTVVFSHGYSPVEILRQIKSRRVSVLVCVPKVLDVLREHLQRAAPIVAEKDVLEGRHFLWRWWRYRAVHRLFGWKFWAIVCGAAPLEPELEAFWRKLGFLVVQGYGLTETAPVVTLNHPFRASKGTVGKPLEGVDVKIAPDGEILVRGDNVTSGYYRAPGQDDRSAAEQGAAFEGGWFHTGDIGELDASGQLLIKGRKKEMIVTPQGLNVFPEDVERALLAQRGVREAAVVGVRVEGEERVHGVLVIEPGADVPAIVRAANATLEDHQRVWSSSVWPGDALPRTEGTQKLKRRDIQRWAAGAMEAGSSDPARLVGTASNPSVEAVVARFAAGRDISASTTLDELGLSSLDRVELIMALEEAFRTTLDEGALEGKKTIQDIRTLVTGAEVQSSEFKVQSPDSDIRTSNFELRTSAEPIVFPSWNRWRTSWFLRRISLPTWILPLQRPFVKMTVTGREHLDALAQAGGPVVFAANHQSHMDVPVMMLAMPARWRYRVAPAMAKEFFRPHFFPDGFPAKKVFWNRVWYYLSAMFFNAFPLPQREAGTRQALRYMGDVLNDGYSIVIFPEGERRAAGEIAPFRGGIGMIGARLGVPVVPVRIEGLDKVLHPKMRWPKRGPVRVAFGAPLRLVGEDYQALAKQVEEAVRALGTHEPVNP
jgi:long-chain acyl-CoA synthetase